MKKFIALVIKRKGKTAMNEWESDDFFELDTVYIKELGKLFFHT